MDNQQMLNAFEQMWGPFPEPVMLIRKDRTILAANDLARTAGISAGIKCFSLNPEAATSACKDCKANLALREHRTVCCDEVRDGNRIVGYWMPLVDAPDVYVHFGVGCAEAAGIQPYPILRKGKSDLVPLTH
jgi:hypothetical protein